MNNQAQDSSINSTGNDKILRYGWSDTGEQGVFKLIHKNSIEIPEDSYQRSATGNPANAKILKIASEFSWVAFQIISVAMRDGVYYSIDGGHRLRAARRRSDITMVPCMVYPIDSIKGEAKAFDVVNSNRKPMSAVDRHRAHLIQDDPVALEAERYAAIAGRKITKNPGPGTITCVNDLKKCIKENPAALDDVWPLVVDICRGRKMPQNVLMGLYYLQKYSSEPPTSTRISNKIRSVGYDEIEKAAKAGAAFHGHASPKSFADGMTKVINKGLHNKIQLPGKV